MGITLIGTVPRRCVNLPPGSLRTLISCVVGNKVEEGDALGEFYQGFGKWLGVPYVFGAASGRSAFQLALEASGLEKGAEIIFPVLTFPVIPMVAKMLGYKPVFCGVDPETFNSGPEHIEPRITEETGAVLATHLFGQPCPIREVVELAQERDVLVIEDCAQAHGALYRDQPVGSFGDIGAWSFCQDKIMTTGGEGGMFTTNDSELWSRMWSYKDHGKSYEAVYEREHPPGFRWLHESFGTNWRMIEMQAAIGRIQLQRMPDWHRRRLEIANIAAC